ncbi:MAG: hypothetical protein JO032_09550 [Alphaproteobacteria bacterium]|nr:hypothetical protein [Alphaproteobacteria bacterium]
MLGFTKSVGDIKATVSSFTTRIAIAAGLGVAALLVVIVTLWFLGDALLSLLQEHGFRRSAAAALTGAAGLILVGVLAISAKLAMRPRTPAVPAAPPPALRPSTGSVVNDLALGFGGYAAEQLGTTVRTHPYSTIGSALAAGLALGAIPELRKAIFSMTHKR